MTKFNPVHAAIFNAIADERARQDALKAAGKFQFTCADDGMSSAEKALALGEEYGEVCSAVLELTSLARPAKAGLTNDELQEHLAKELVQVAAVAVAWLESLG